MHLEQVRILTLTDVNVLLKLLNRIWLSRTWKSTLTWKCFHPTNNISLSPAQLTPKFFWKSPNPFGWIEVKKLYLANIENNNVDTISRSTTSKPKVKHVDYWVNDIWYLEPTLQTKWEIHTSKEEILSILKGPCHHQNTCTI